MNSKLADTLERLVLAHSTRLLLLRKADAHKMGASASGCFAVPARESAACQNQTVDYDLQFE